MTPPFRIKICGVASVEDARLAVAAGADAIGLNFYRLTPRFVAPENATVIRRVLPDHVCCVGVFVNAPVAEVVDIAERVDLAALQFHGDEPPEYLAEVRAAGERLRSLSLIRAFRCRDNAYSEIAAYLDELRRRSIDLAAVLIDAFVAGKYGGGGEVIDWQAFRAARPLFGGLPRILAGGLTAENVEASIAAAAPDAVDVASGVETQPGIKDPDKVQHFVANAQRAFERATS